MAAFGGYVVTGSQLSDFAESRVSRSIQIADDLYLLASPEVEDGDLVNHSCDPNCETVIEGARVFIEAIRTIQPGEELTYDYRLTIDGKLTKKERAQYVCRCGTPRCRGTLLHSKK